MKETDYPYYKDCKEYVDLWAYGYDIEDTGHDKCNWRYVTKEEFKECIKECKQFGCFKERRVL